jgi:trans-aconitate methyltransferase
MFDAAMVDPAAAVIDVGGGTSRLVDVLLGRGFRDLSVLDVSAVALAEARQRLADRAGAVDWLVQDVRSWRAGRRYDVWHDRAVFHFQTSPADRDRYLASLEQATHPGSIAIIATFAPDGPTHCSGLPVARYDADQLAAELAPAWQLRGSTRQQH